MKHTLYKLLLSVFVTFAQVIVPTLTGSAGGGSALQAQDAFYIYRNDGDFDGFFYDQVVRMGYSKFDLDSVEHDVYVIQEIETADSLYRIPLSAIDSIGFRQPEIRFNPRLRHMDKLGMTPYVDAATMDEESGTAQIVFSASIPANLKPDVDDVLAGFDEDKFGAGGFVAKVTKVTTDNGQTLCSCSFVEDWSDIFEQLITVETVGTDANGNVKRYMAGFDANGAPRRVSGNYDMTLFSWSGRLQKEWKPSDNTSLNVGLDLGAEAKLNVVYNISTLWGSRCFIKLVFSENFSAGFSFHAQYSTGYEWELPTPLSVIGGIKFPAFFPLFEVDPTPKGFVRIGGTADIGLQLPKVDFGFSQTITIDSELPEMMSFKWGDRDKQESGYNAIEGEGTAVGLGVVFNGFIQAGAKATLGMTTNTWLSKLLHAGIALEIFAGPKLEGEVNLDISGGWGRDYYALWKESKFEFSRLCFDRELKYKWRVGGKKVERTLWSDTQKFGATTYYLYPNFLETQATANDTTKQVNVTVYPRRKIFKQKEIGIAAYDKEGTLVASRFGRKYGFASTFNEYKNAFSYTDFPKAGKYNIRPAIREDELILYAADAGKDVDIPPYVQLSADTLVYQSDNANETQAVTLKTNSDDLTVKLAMQQNPRYNLYKATTWPVGQTLPDWAWLDVTENISETGERKLIIKTTKAHSKSIVDRHALIIVTAKGGEKTCSDTIQITQLGTTRLPRHSTLEIAVGGNVRTTNHHTLIYTGGWSENEGIDEHTDKVVTTALHEKIINGKILDQDDGSYYTVSNISSTRNGNLLLVTGRLEGSESSRDDYQDGRVVTWQSKERSTNLTITATFDVAWQTAKMQECSIKLNQYSKEKGHQENGSDNTFERTRTTSDIGEGVLTLSWTKNQYGEDSPLEYTVKSYTRQIESEEKEEQNYFGKRSSSINRYEETHDVANFESGSGWCAITFPSESEEWVYD